MKNIFKDFSDAKFRATLRRRDPSKDKQNKDEKKNGQKAE
jgi:hypothetical protein